MDFPTHLLIPLGCAFLYVLGALSFKRAAECGVGVWRTSFVANWAMVAVFLPGWLLVEGAARPVGDYWQPALVGLCFLGGQVFIFLALSRGDVSVTTPVMGLKVVLVALFSSVLQVGAVPLAWWLGAALSAVAVALLHAGEARGVRGAVRAPAALAAASAASYGLGDVLMQKWVPGWGPARFFPAMFLLVGLFSCAFIPLFRAPLWSLPPAAWRWVGAGAVLMAANNAGIVLTLGVWGEATAVNIVYSIRGLLAVLLVGAIGHWFGSAERHLAGRVRRRRLLGAGLMVAAVVLALA